MNKQLSMIDKLPGRSELQETIAVANYLRLLKNMGKVKTFSHINHELHTASWTARRNKVATGVARGVPDFFIIFPADVLFIELKIVKGGTISPDQKVWIESLNATGKVHAKVCRGFDEAKECIDSFL